MNYSYRDATIYNQITILRDIISCINATQASLIDPIYISDRISVIL